MTGEKNAWIKPWVTNINTCTPFQHKLEWQKFHQQHMSALTTNKNIQTVLFGDLLIQGLPKYTKV